MTHEPTRRVVTRTLACTVLAIGSCLGSACASKQRAAADTERRDAMPGGSGTAAATAMLDKKPPRMLKRIDSSLTAADLQNYLTGGNLNEYQTAIAFDSDFSGHHAHVGWRPGETSQGTADTAHPVDIEAVPVRGNYLIDRAQDFSDGMPRLMARFHNRGAGKEHGLQLPAGGDGFWFVQSDAGVLRSYILAVDARQLKQLSFEVCHHTHPTDEPVGVAVADFRHDCVGVRILQVGDPPWMPCIQGCCVGGNLT